MARASLPVAPLSDHHDEGASVQSVLRATKGGEIVSPAMTVTEDGGDYLTFAQPLGGGQHVLRVEW